MLYKIITALQNTQGSNAKKAILEANKDNELLKEYLRVTYDPRINFYIKQLPIPVVNKEDNLDDFELHDIELLVERIAGRQYTGYDAKAYLRIFFSELTENGEALARYMLLKDIKAGISVSTINKVWPDLIFSQGYMRCSLPKDVDLVEWPWKEGVYSQVKMDGMYAAVSNKQMITRNGSVFPYDLLPEQFKEDMGQITEGFELNGELLLTNGERFLSRKEGNGILNSLLQGTPIPEEYSLRYVIWDVKGFDKPYGIRFALLSVTPLVWLPSFSLIANRTVYSYEEAVAHFQEVLAQGLEGTVLKHPDMVWKDGTSKHQVKFKIEVDIDLLCTGMIEGTGKYKGMLGALQLESGCGKVRVDCGTGFTDAQRKNLWENGYPVGKIVEIKANDLLDKVGSDTLSLFLPVFKSVRIDKDVADDLERIECSFNSAKGLT